MPNPVAGACGFVGIMVSVPALIAIFTLGKRRLLISTVIRYLRLQRHLWLRDCWPKLARSSGLQRKRKHRDCAFDKMARGIRFYVHWRINSSNDCCVHPNKV